MTGRAIFTEAYAVIPGGGSDHPETEPGTQAVLFVLDGAISAQIRMISGGRLCLYPPDAD